MASKKSRSAGPKDRAKAPREKVVEEAPPEPPVETMPKEPAKKKADPATQQAKQDPKSKAPLKAAKDKPKVRRSIDPLVAICVAVLLLSSVVVLAATIDDKFFPEKDAHAATAWDKVKVDYVGSYYGYYDQGGMVFDTNISSIGNDAKYIKAYDFGTGKKYEPLEFVVGQGTMLKMFDEALLGMKPGESKRIAIPVGEGYGDGTSLKAYAGITGIILSQTLYMNTADCTAYLGLTPQNNMTVKTPYGWDATVTQDSTTGAWTITHNPVVGTSYTPKADTSDNPAVKYKVTELAGNTLKFDYEFSSEVGTKMSSPAGWHVKALDKDGKTIFLYGSTADGTQKYQYKYPLTEKNEKDEQVSVEKNDMKLFFEIRFIGYA